MASFNTVWTKNTNGESSQKKWSTADKVKMSNKTAGFKNAKDTRNAKKSKGKAGTSVKGKTKKGGAGSGVRWGRPGDEMDYKTILDKDDPNYDSQGDDDTAFFVGSGDTGTHGYGRTYERAMSPKRNGYKSERGITASAAITLKEFKKEIIKVLEEYFVSFDMEEVERNMFEINCPEYHYEFVKRSITMAMDRNENGCEVASKLLSYLYPKVLTTDQIGKGFERLFEVCDDLLIDVPNAEKIVARFIARAVVDEIIPPKFLMDKDVMKLGGPIIKQARVLLSIKHASARMTKSWGPGDGRSAQELKSEIKMILSEYFVAHDLKETTNCIISLNASRFYHELVKRAVIFAMSKKEEDQKSISILFKHLFSFGGISSDQYIIGFARLFDEIDDINLDTPNAGKIFEGFVFRGMADGYLPDNFMLLVAASGGDGEQIRRLYQEFETL